jgi:uncharacterized protein YecE (DUF72 family)
MADASKGEIAICEGHLSRQPIRVGCAGWTVPREAAAHFDSGGSHLERYSQVFNSCEINSSFYRPHKNETWERWARTVPAHFRFSVKAPRTITHEASLNCAPEVLLEFLKQISFLGDKLGPILIQLPPSLKFEYARVRSFLSLLSNNYSGEMVWEPRHCSWFDDGVDDLLREFRAARVAADPARVPAAARPGGLANLAYFRLHGSPRMYYSAYTDNYLNMLAAQLANLTAEARVWCVFDNTASGYAIQNALQLTAELKSTSTIRK